MIEERILDFLDGRLGHAEEEELLHTLAISPERRGMLREHMRLREISQNLSRSSELTVPCPTTAGLFARLTEQGFAGPVPMPVSAPTAPILPTMPVPIPAQSGIRFMYFAAGVLVAMIAGLSMSLFKSPTEQPVRFVHDTTVVRSGQAVAEVPVANKASDRTYMSHRTYKSYEPVELSHSQSSIASNVAAGEEPIANNAEKAIVNRSAAVATPQISKTVTAVPTQNSSIVLATPVAELSATKQHVPFIAHDDDATVPSKIPFAFGIRTGAGPVLGGTMSYVNSLSELKMSWQPLSWLVAKASIGILASHETMASELGPDMYSGVRTIGTQRILTTNTVGSIELGLNLPIFGKQFEFAGGLGGDASGVLYPRASIFTSFTLTNTLFMNIGVEAMSYTHDITGSVVQKKQLLAGSNLAVSDHASSERSGFIGPSIEFSWHP